MSGYDSKNDVEANWTYRDLLEMIYIEDLKAISEYKAQKKYEDQQELENALTNG